MDPVVFFTISSANYLDRVRVLHSSLVEHIGAVTFHLVLVDRIEDKFDPSLERFPVIEAERLPIPDFEVMAFRYNIVELNTAVKPFAFLHLFEKYPNSAIVYLDPDILVTGPMSSLRGLLTAGAEAVLTPHICAPVVDDGQEPAVEHMILQVGIYNLGFLALKPTDEVKQFVEWWGDKLRKDCVSEWGTGLFVDQKWCDVLPAFVSRTAILRDPGYNVACWNLMQRVVSRLDGAWRVNRTWPLEFVHFSGVDVRDSNVFAKWQMRYSASEIGELRILLDDYKRKIREMGHESVSRLPYSYGMLPGGFRIPNALRKLFREDLDSTIDKPNDHVPELISFSNQAEPSLQQRTSYLITRLMYRIWRDRKELQEAFDLHTAAGQATFVNWFIESAQSELSIDSIFLDKVKDSALPEHVARDSSLEVGSANTGNPSRLDRILSRIAKLLLLNVTKLRRVYRHVPVRTRLRLKSALLRRAHRVPSTEPRRSVKSNGVDVKTPEQC